MSTEAPATSNPGEPLLDAEGSLAEDLICRGCGYNLRTLHPSALCPECGADIHESIQLRALQKRGGWTLYRFGWLSRALSLVYGCIVPGFAFWIAEGTIGPLLVEYQTGRWEDRVFLLIGGAPARCFYPFVLWSIGSMVALIVRPVSMARYRTVRLGVWTGIVLCAHFLLILFSKGGVKGLVIASTVLLGTAMVAWVLVKVRWSFVLPRRFVAAAWAVTGFGVFGLFVLNVLVPDSLGIWAMLILGSLVFSPGWALCVYVAMAIRLVRSRIDPLGGWWAWGAGWLKFSLRVRSSMRAQRDSQV